MNGCAMCQLDMDRHGIQYGDGSYADCPHRIRREDFVAPDGSAPPDDVPIQFRRYGHLCVFPPGSKRYERMEGRVVSWGQLKRSPNGWVIGAAQRPKAGATIYFREQAYTPDEARAIAAGLVTAADAIEAAPERFSEGTA